MPGSDPQIGDVYYYPYIWKRQTIDRWGKPIPIDDVEAEKDRPCCIAVRLKNSFKDGKNVFILAISSSGYPEGGTGIEIPHEEIALIKGLDPNVRRWITTSEDNRTLSTSPIFHESEYRGTFSKKFCILIYSHIRDLIIKASEDTGT